MTEEHIKEQLSDRFIGILAVNNGFIFEKNTYDSGIDFQLKKTITYKIQNGGLRHSFDPKYIDIQLKSTTEKSIVYENEIIKYDLEVKTYNDLIYRLNECTPLVLILFILPCNKDQWVEINESEIKLRKNAYWYVPPKESEMSDNTSRIRIDIPKSNLLKRDCFSTLYEYFFS